MGNKEANTWLLLQLTLQNNVLLSVKSCETLSSPCKPLKHRSAWNIDIADGYVDLYDDDDEDDCAYEDYLDDDGFLMTA